MMTTVEKVLLLKGIELFAEVPSDELAAIALIAEEVRAEAGETILREGDHGDALYFIVEGRARVAKGERTLAELGERAVFGELALLDPGPRSASVEADQELVCYVVTEELLERLRQEHPAIAIKLMSNLGRELSRRLRRANRTIYQLEG